MFRRLLSGVLAATMLFAIACSDSPSDPDPQPDPTSDLKCTAPALASASAKPFDRVEVSGISGLDQAWVEYETGSGTTGLTPVMMNGSGKYEILVPPHPDTLMAGGTLTLTVTDGIRSCASLQIDVLATDPADGDPVAETLAAFDGLVAEFAKLFDLDPASVATTSLDVLPAEAVPFALLLEARAAFDPATVLAGMTPDEIAFTQAMVDSWDVPALLDDFAASLEAPAATRGSADPVYNARREGCSDLGTVPAGLFDLSTPEKLRDRMEDSRAASAAGGPLAQAIGDYGTAFAVMGLAVPQVGLVAGWLTFIAQTVQKMVSGLYPSSITRLEFQVDETRIEEDWDVSRGDPEIKWNFAKVWATNTGMGLARVGIDLITTAVPLPGPFGNQIADDVVDIVGKEAINKRLDELEQDPESDAECWGVGVTEFGPVVIPDETGEQWARAEVLTGNAISIQGANGRTVKPEQIGTATLRVRTTEDAFPGPFGFDDQQVEVVRKSIAWIPRTLLVDNPGETVTVKFRVDDAKHLGAEDVEVTPGPNLPPLTVEFSGGVHSITFQTPDEGDDYPTWIDARSVSKELPPGTPAREGRIEIFANETVEIAKKDPCVGNGETETFTATAGGPDDPVVMWEIESGAGELSADTGLSVDYIAPNSGSGQVTLRAYLSTNSEIEDRVSFTYGACAGLAVYYAIASEISFPFVPDGECNNPDLDAEHERFTIPEDGLLPEVLPSPSDVWVGRSETLTHQLLDSGNFGDTPPGSEVCEFGSFNAKAEYSATLTGSQDGTRLDVDITTNAGSNAEVVAGDNQSSTASAAVALAGRWDFDLTGAANYRLNVNLNCDSDIIPGFPILSGRVSIIAIQIDPAGNPVLGNQSTAPIQVQCQPGVPLIIDRLMQFPAPSNPGQTDHVMIMFTMDNVSFGALETDSGQVDRDGFLRGFISVEKE